MQHKTTLAVSSFIFVFGIVTLAMPMTSYAEDATSTPSATSTPTTHSDSNTKTTTNFDGGILELIRNVNKEASASASRSAKNLSEIISRADSLITSRLDQLNSLITRINSDKRLTDDEKTSLNAEINTAISGLTTLKAKIDADTDATTAMTDAKTIYSGFRVYEELEPKISLLIILNNAKSSATNLQTLLPSLQNLIDSYGAQGKDVSQLNVLISDISTQVTSILTTVNNDITTVEGVTVSTTNPQTTFTQVRQDILNTLKTAFGKIRTDVQAMRPIFKGFINPSATPSSSPTATTSATTQ